MKHVALSLCSAFLTLSLSFPLNAETFPLLSGDKVEGTLVTDYPTEVLVQSDRGLVLIAKSPDGKGYLYVKDYITGPGNQDRTYYATQTWAAFRKVRPTAMSSPESIWWPHVFIASVLGFLGGEAAALVATMPADGSAGDINDIMVPALIGGTAGAIWAGVSTNGSVTVSNDRVLTIDKRTATPVDVLVYDAYWKTHGPTYPAGIWGGSDYAKVELFNKYITVTPLGRWNAYLGQVTPPHTVAPASYLLRASQKGEWTQVELSPDQAAALAAILKADRTVPSTYAALLGIQDTDIPDLSAVPGLAAAPDFTTATPFDQADGSVVYGFGTTQTSSTTILLVRPNGSWLYGTYQNGLLNGPVVTANNGTVIHGQFSAGIPTGTWTSPTDPGLSFTFTNGTLDTTSLGSSTTALQELGPLQDQLNSLLGTTLDSTEKARLTSILATTYRTQDQANKIFGAYNLASLVASQPLATTVTTPDGITWDVGSFERHEVRDSFGTLMEITTTAAATGSGTDTDFALQLSYESLKKLDMPVSMVNLISGQVGGAFAMALGTRTFGADGGLSLRGFGNAGGPIPGALGGTGESWEYRVAATGSFTNVSAGSYNASTGAGNLKLGGGYTWYSFEPTNAQTLQAAGSGTSLGVLVNVALPFPEYAWPVTPEPYYSFESYSYNPGAARYSAQSLTLGYLFPLGLKLTWAFSF